MLSADVRHRLLFVCSDLLCREVMFRIQKVIITNNILCQGYGAEIQPQDADLFCFMSTDVVAGQATDLGIFWAHFHAAESRVLLIDFDRPTCLHSNPAIWNPLLDFSLPATTELFSPETVPAAMSQPASYRFLQRSRSWFSVQSHAGIAPLVAKLRDRLFQLCDCLYDGEEWFALQPLLPGLSVAIENILRWQEDVLNFYSLLPDKRELRDWCLFFSALQVLAEEVCREQKFQPAEGEALLVLIDRIDEHLIFLKRNLYE